MLRRYGLARLAHLDRGTGRVMRRLDAGTDKYRYGKAITMLRQLRDAYRAIGDATGLGTYLDHLRNRHNRKTAFIAKLDHAGL